MRAGGAKNLLSRRLVLTRMLSDNGLRARSFSALVTVSNRSRQERATFVERQTAPWQSNWHAP